MDIRKVVCGLLQENAYVVDGGIIIDPGDDFEAIDAAVTSPKAVLLTHGHFDHMLAAEKLQEKYDIPVYVHEEDAPMLSDAGLCVYMPEMSTLPMPQKIRWEAYPEEILGFRVLHTPGHSRGSVCLYNEDDGVLFSGDTMFCAGYGRTDLPGGNERKLVESLLGLLKMPADTRVLPGHGEETTIGIECRRYGR